MTQQKTLNLSLRMALAIAVMTVPLFISIIGGYYLYSHIQSSLREATEETIDELIPLVNLKVAIIQIQLPAHDY